MRSVEKQKLGTLQDSLPRRFTEWTSRIMSAKNGAFGRTPGALCASKNVRGRWQKGLYFLPVMLGSILQHFTSRSFSMARAHYFHFLLAIFLGCAATGFCQTSTSIAFEYAKVAYPGALLTQVNGINNNNVIVGSYFDSASVEHGFVYRNGKFSAFDFPGATASEVLGVNDLGDIVGTYQLSGALNFHGFIRRNGAFKTLDDPKATFGTMAFAVDKAGTVVGSYDNAHGFAYSNGNFRTLDAPQPKGETPETQLNGINNLGWIAGQVLTGGIWRGFWIVGSDLDWLEAAGTRDSQVTGINGRGDIVGCHDAQSGFVAFAVESGEGAETREAFPAQHALASCASGINYARAVVGNYFTVSRPYGFLAIPALTLNVKSPPNHASTSNPVQVSASASGNNAVAQIQVWVNSKEIFHVSGGTLNKGIQLPLGSNERFVVQAVDSKGTTTKVVETISVH